ncbi:MAG: hypothetical protein ABIG29_03370 [Candidatus Nealsonbacteria bacterium]
MEKMSTNFFNYGTYKTSDADILRKELEGARIPVKTLYPETGAGKEVAVGAYRTAYKLLIRVCDFQRVEKIRNDLGIAPVEAGEPAPKPKTYGRAKYALGRFFLIGMVIFLSALIVLIILNDLSHSLKSSIDVNFLGDVLMAGYSLFALLLTGSLVYIFFKDWFRE